jgi:hypothetical protein
MKSSWTRIITWEERNEFVGELRKLPNGQAVVDAFEAVGTSRPVELDASASQPLREAVHAMEIRRRSTLTQGLRELRNALVQG